MLARLRKAQEENESGFTLIELLVVMIIIGILAAIAIPAFLNQKKKAQESAAKSDATNISKEIAAALVDGSIFNLDINTTTGGYLLTWSDANGTGEALVKASNGQVPTLAGGATTATTLAGASADYCVTVTPDLDGTSPWSAGPNGLFKGADCT